VLTRLDHRINLILARYLPEQRLFLKNETSTRYLRLRPLTQAIALTGTTLVLGWSIIATAILLIGWIGAGSGRDQTLRQQALYEQRLTALSDDRNQRAEEAAHAQQRFNLALAEVSQMQERLLASEDSRKELTTGIDVIQNTLRRTIKERDEARLEATGATLALVQQGGNTAVAGGGVSDTLDTLEFVTAALSATARQRDDLANAALAAKQETATVALAKQALEMRNDMIFARLEEAVTVSMEPLDKMFRAAGMAPEDLLDQVRSAYSGQGGPLMPFVASTMGDTALTPDEIRANAILEGLDRMNLYRIAAEKSPFSMPVKAAFRFTSGFGYRHDPKGAGNRMHTGTDFAGAAGTPVLATADGVVVHADWSSGYGRLVRIKHAFGIETYYAHLAQIRVKVGQKVSRGDRIGDMGSSGRSTGTHLHYEVRIAGKPVNAMTFIKAARDVF